MIKGIHYSASVFYGEKIYIFNSIPDDHNTHSFIQQNLLSAYYVPSSVFWVPGYNSEQRDKGHLITQPEMLLRDRLSSSNIRT